MFLTATAPVDAEHCDLRLFEKPPLVAGDGPIALLRRWARQFHETPGSAPESASV